MTISSDRYETPTRRKQIVLLSGGVESSTVLRHVHSTHPDNVIPLFFDYGQRARESERRASRAQCKQLSLGEDALVEADLSPVGEMLRARQVERRHVPLFHRNAVLLSVAASLAAQEGATGVWIAVSADDASWYPSASPEFVRRMGAVLQALDAGLQLHAPLVRMRKADVVRWGTRLGVEWESTWSCMLRYDRHCGRCVQCKARRTAFAECGVVEMDGFYQR